MEKIRISRSINDDLELQNTTTWGLQKNNISHFVCSKKDIKPKFPISALTNIFTLSVIICKVVTYILKNIRRIYEINYKALTVVILYAFSWCAKPIAVLLFANMH